MKEAGTIRIETVVGQWGSNQTRIPLASQLVIFLYSSTRYTLSSRERGAMNLRKQRVITRRQAVVVSTRLIRRAAIFMGNFIVLCLPSLLDA